MHPESMNILRENFKHIAFLAAAVWGSLGLLALRIDWSGNASFVFLAWNLFLALIPLALAMLAALLHRSDRLAFLFWPILCVWLAFFPNAPYIITDLLHLKARPGVPLWFDALLLFSFAFNGLWLGLISLRINHSILRERFGAIIGWIFASVSILLGGVGVYIGRFLRFNSWDLPWHAERIIRMTFEALTNPAQHPETAGVILILSAFSMFAYLLIVSVPQEN